MTDDRLITELSLRVADDEASPEEREALARMLEADPAARRVHLLTLELEGALRGGGPMPDLAPAVLARLPRLDAGPAPARRARQLLPRFVPRLVPRFVPLVAAAAALLLAAGVWRAGRRRPPPVAPGPGSVATLVDAAGKVALVRPGAPAVGAAAPGTPLAIGDRVETAAGATSATVDAFGGARLTLGPATAVALAEDPAARLVRIDRGAVGAAIAPRGAAPPIAFVTPHARATVRGTRLRLEVRADATRLAVTEGEVIFERLADGATLSVGAGEEALAAARPLPPRRPAPQADPAPQALRVTGDALAPALSHGQVVPCPGRPGSCALGGLYPHTGRTNAIVFMREEPPLLAWGDDLVVSFDYLAGPDARDLTVQLWDARLRRNYHLRFCELARGGWGRAEVALADFVPNLRRAPRPQPGDPLTNLFVAGGELGGSPLYVDLGSLRIEPRELRAPREPGAAPLRLAHRQGCPRPPR